MKRILTLIVGVCLLLPFLLCGCSDTTEKDDLGDSLITTSEYSLKFIEGKCEYYYDDEYLMLFFELTNTSGGTATPEDLVSIEAFQNGVELTLITFNGQRIDDAIAIDVSVQNGATATVVWMFYPDDYSDVSVETSDGQAFTVELVQDQVEKIDFDNAAGAVLYTNHEFTSTKYGTDIVIIYFTFTNNTDDYLSLHDVANFRAYQDGIEIEGCQLDTDAGDNSWKEIAKDKSLDCAIAFKTTSKNSVQLRVSPIIDGCFDSSVYQEQELLSSGQDSANHTCIVDGCSKEGSIKYDGLSGSTEYYCNTHYDELLETMKEIMGEDSQLYKYSEYIKEEYLRDELLEWFSEYNIRYYDESVVEEFSDMDLPKPETAIANYPSYMKEDGSYLYGFDEEEECRVYLSAYMVYLMNFDYEVTDIGNNVYSIDNEYYIGLGKIDGKYCFMIVEL